MIQLKYVGILLVTILVLARSEGDRIRRSYAPNWNMWRGIINQPYMYPLNYQYAYPIIQRVHPTISTKRVTTEQITSQPTTPTIANTISTTTTIEPTTTAEPTTTNTTTTVTNDSQNEFERSFTLTPTANNSNILQKCKNVRFKSLRDSCIRVAQNPILKGMDDVKGYIGEEENNQPTLLITRGFSFLKPTLGTQTICNEPETCPDYTVDDRPTRKNLLSLSPWVMCREYDPNRFPQWINVAKCLCGGCINYRTGQEEVGDVVSQELRVDINVLKKDILTRTFGQCTRKTCREEVQSVAIGCHCALADLRVK
ncbi:uncharacterized protein LOC120343373 [Styela clava]